MWTSRSGLVYSQKLIQICTDFFLKLLTMILFQTFHFWLCPDTVWKNLYQGWQAFWNVIWFFRFYTTACKMHRKANNDWLGTIFAQDQLFTTLRRSVKSSIKQRIFQCLHLKHWVQPGLHLLAERGSMTFAHGQFNSNLLKVAVQVVQFSVILTVGLHGQFFHSTLATFVQIFEPFCKSIMNWQSRQRARTLWEGFPGLHRYAGRGRSLKS